MTIKAFTIILCVVVVGVAGYLAYYVLSQRQDKTAQTQQTAPITTNNQTVEPDGLSTTKGETDTDIETDLKNFTVEDPSSDLKSLESDINSL